MKRPARTRAFTLVEVLMALAVMGLLLSSLGVAVHASLLSYRENEKTARATQLARVVLTRMMREIRTCTDADSTSTTLTITSPNDGSDLQQVIYQVNNDSLICCRTEQDGTTNTSTLIGPIYGTSVQSMAILREVDGQSGEPMSVTVRLNLAVDDHTFDVDASARLRKKQTF